MSAARRQVDAQPTGAPTCICKIGHDPAAIERLLVDLFLDARPKPKRSKPIIFDLYATHSILHGEQEGRFFSGFCY